MADQKDYKDEKAAVDVFTHSSTGFPGAWSENEIGILLDAWEEAVKSPRSSGKVFDVAEKVLDILKKKDFRSVERDEVWKQMSTLRTEYRTYLGLVKIGIPTVRASCVDKLELILRRSTARRRRRRRTSTASNQIGSISEDDGGGIPNGTMSQPESVEDENTSRARRVRFQRQSLQRSVRTMIAQQRTIMENISTFMKNFSESNDKIIFLLGELVALQKISDKTVSVTNVSSPLD